MVSSSIVNITIMIVIPFTISRCILNSYQVLLCHHAPMFHSLSNAIDVASMILTVIVVVAVIPIIEIIVRVVATRKDYYPNQNTLWYHPITYCNP